MTNSPKPELSIVVAASHASHVIAECLGALEPQISGHDVELIVVALTAADARNVRERFPNATLIEAEPSRLIPELWGIGATRARGRVIAITIGTCIPDAHWVENILRAHTEDVAAVGGAIESARGASLVDWAVYFVRYTPFMLPFRAGPMEVAGDNGTYKRAALADQMQWITTHGFWEAEVNANLRRQRQQLWGDPSIVVYHNRSFTFGGFTRQRFEHGRIFGRMRAAKVSTAQRAIYIVTAPAIPFVLFARIIRNVLRRKRNLGIFMLSLPLIVWFLLYWSLGEFLGLIRE
jgi:hypothetical protein